MFAPEAPFLASHAKGRDKYTYALSDYGVVVAAEENKGGTWAGATEQLTRLKHVPVFVRAASEVPSGNTALLSMGGRPLPSLDALGSVRAFLDGKVLAANSNNLPIAEEAQAAFNGVNEEPSASEFTLSPEDAVSSETKIGTRKKRPNSTRKPDSRIPVDEVAANNAIRVLVSGDGEGISFWKLGDDGELRAWLDVVNFAPYPIKIDRIVGEVLVRNTPIARLHHLKRENVRATSDGRIYVQSDLSPEQVKKVQCQLIQPEPPDTAGFRLTIYVETEKGSLELSHILNSGNVRFVNFETSPR